MSSWARTILLFIREQTAVFFAILVVFTILGAVLVFELVRRRTPVAALPTPNAPGYLGGGKEPIVLSSRWVKLGTAATTADGGCFILVEKVWPARNVATVSVRIDGEPLLQGEELEVGQSMDLEGKAGSYRVSLQGTRAQEASMTVRLRSRHS